MSETRQFERVKKKVEVTIKLVGGSAITGELPEFTAHTKDISEGGVFLELLGIDISKKNNVAVDNFLLFKSVLELSIDLPGSLVQVQGRAVWIEKEMPDQEFRRGVAVAFNDISTEQKNQIKRFIA